MRAKASFLILTTIAIGPVVAASEWAPSGPFDEQVTIEFGFNNSDIKSRFSVDGNIADQNLGAQVNLENLFGLDDSSSDTRMRFNWRIRPRHSLSLERYDFKRSASAIAAEGFNYGELNVAAGASISSRFDLSFEKYQYAYSALQNNKHELRLLAGINVLKLDAGLNASGTSLVYINGEELKGGGSYTVSSDSRSPIPTIGADYTYAITPWWTVNMGAEYFQLNQDGLSGRVVSWELSTEAHIANNVIVGVRYSDYQFDVSSKQNRWRGRFDWRHNGPTAYVGLRFGSNSKTSVSTLSETAPTSDKIAQIIGPYVQLALGISSQSSQFSRKTVDSVSVAPEASSSNDEDLSFAVGYRLTPYWGVELAKVSFNKFWGGDEVKKGEQVSPGGGQQSYNLDSKMEVEAVVPWLVAYYPLSDHIELQARIGYGFYDASYGVTGNIRITEPGRIVRFGYNESNSDINDAVALGLGGYWRFTTSWAVGGQYQYHNSNFVDSGNEADWSNHRLSINLRYSF